MDEEYRQILENIRSMTRKYRNIPGAASENVNALLDEIELIREKVQRGLALIASVEQGDPGRFQEIGEALQEAREASVTAEIYVQGELQDAREMLGSIRSGNKARKAYQPSTMGMGFSEGSFIDRRK